MKVVRRIVEEGIRIDGRGCRLHGHLRGRCHPGRSSGLFQRGETQVLNITTLGMGRSDVMIDDLSPLEKNATPTTTLRPSRRVRPAMRGPKTSRDRSRCARRACSPAIVELRRMALTVRTLSEVMASNGSSSMGSVCGSTLSPMDAGVPIKAPVAGIAMGLVHAEGERHPHRHPRDRGCVRRHGLQGRRYHRLHHRLQLDTKITGIPANVLAGALSQAREARLDILDIMLEAIPSP